MAKKKGEKTTVEKPEVINVADISKLINTVTNDVKKDFEVETFDENFEYSFLSTGNPGINYAISNRFDGGFPEGLITEIAGENATGKTLLALHALVATQKKGGIAVLIDAEFAFNPLWFETLGGDPKALIHYQPRHIDDVYSFIGKVVEATRKKSATVPLTIVYDSVAASPSKKEYEGAEYDMGKRAQGHGKGIRMLMGLCKAQSVTFIAINQLRATFALYGLDKDTVGGAAWKYATSLRIHMKKGKKIKQKMAVGEKIVGIAGSLVVNKSRLRAPFATADFNVYYEGGIDPLSGLYGVCRSEGIIQPAEKEDGGISKGWWVYKDVKFQEASFAEKVLSKYPELLGGHALIDIPDASLLEIESGDDDGDVNVNDALM